MSVVTFPGRPAASHATWNRHLSALTSFATWAQCQDDAVPTRIFQPKPLPNFTFH